MIQDLNIVNLDRESYTVSLKYKNGLIGSKKNVSLDMFTDDDDTTVYLYEQKGVNFVDVTFTPRKT